MSVRGLTPEQLYDSLTEAIGERLPRQNTISPNAGSSVNDARGRFQRTFTNRSETAVKAQSSIPQTLAMMNGNVTANGIRKRRKLGGEKELAFLDDQRGLVEVYFSSPLRRSRPGEC